METVRLQQNQSTKGELGATAQSFALVYLEQTAIKDRFFQFRPLRPEVSKWELVESRQTNLKKVFPLEIMGSFAIRPAIIASLLMIRGTLLASSMSSDGRKSHPNSSEP